MPEFSSQFCLLQAGGVTLGKSLTSLGLCFLIWKRSHHETTSQVHGQRWHSVDTPHGQFLSVVVADS